MNQADLIAVVKRIDTYNELEPETIKVEVIELLKGKDNRSQLILDSFTAMCDYGIYIKPNETALIMVQNYDKNGPKAADYTRIFNKATWSSALGPFIITNGKIEIIEYSGNTEVFTIEEFKKRYLE